MVGFSSSIKDRKENVSCGFSLQTFSVSFPHFSVCTCAVMRATTGMIHNDITNICNLTRKLKWEFEAGRCRKQEQTSLTASFVTSHRKPQEFLKSSFACSVVSILIYLPFKLDLQIWYNLYDFIFIKDYLHISSRWICNMCILHIISVFYN